jgi:hypothetical protein
MHFVAAVLLICLSSPVTQSVPVDQSELTLDEMLDNFTDELETCAIMRALFGKILRSDDELYQKTLRALVRLNNMTKRVKTPLEYLKVSEAIRSAGAECKLIMEGVKLPVFLPATVAEEILDVTMLRGNRTRRDTEAKMRGKRDGGVTVATMIIMMAIEPLVGLIRDTAVQIVEQNKNLPPPHDYRRALNLYWVEKGGTLVTDDSDARNEMRD